jgi:hypothetical protein
MVLARIVVHDNAIILWPPFERNNLQDNLRERVHQETELISEIDSMRLFLGNNWEYATFSDFRMHFPRKQIE